MNTHGTNDNGMHDHDAHSDDDARLPDALRWQLRALRRDVEPDRELWIGIATRLSAQSASTTVPAAPHASRRLMPMAFRPLAMAASLALVVGTVVWSQRSDDTMTAPAADNAQASTFVQREAQGLTAEYQAALDEMQAPVPASLETTVAELDRDVATIREALAHNPDSVRLLEQLRRTYAHRLALAQRVAYS
ncbi:hypothetical protein [Lysobacter fragariae]